MSAISGYCRECGKPVKIEGASFGLSGYSCLCGYSAVLSKGKETPVKSSYRKAQKSPESASPGKEPQKDANPALRSNSEPPEGNSGRGRRSKYNAIKVTDPGSGEKFDSRLEYRRYLVLRARVAIGEISNLRRQVRYPLEVNGVLVTTYVADFVYTEQGKEVVEDAKGHPTRDYLLKKKLLAALTGIRIAEHKAKPAPAPKKKGTRQNESTLVKDALAVFRGAMARNKGL